MTRKSWLPGAKLRLLFLILLTAMFFTTGAVFFCRMQDTAKKLMNAAPSAIPDVQLYSQIPFSEDETNALRAFGTVRTAPCAVVRDTEARTFVLCAEEEPECAYSLLAGRLPQDGNECVFLSPDGTAVPIGTVYYFTFAGVTRPMVVVGLGQNARTVFSAYRTEAGDIFSASPVLYTVGDVPLNGELLSLNRGRGISMRALRRGVEACSDTHAEAAAAMQNAVSSADTAISAEPNPAACADELLRQRFTETKAALAVLDGQIADAEQALLALSGTLEEKRQIFESEMEKLEHLSANQTTMIPKKEEMEAELAPLEAELAAQKKKLNALLAERDVLFATLTVDEVLPYPASAQMENDGDSALSAVYRDSPALGYSGFRAEIVRESRVFLVIGAVLLLFTAFDAYLLGIFHGEKINRLYRCLCGGTSLSGVLCGGFLFPPMRMRHAFPDFSAWHTMTLHLPTVLPVLFLSALLCAVVPLLAFYAAKRKK